MSATGAHVTPNDDDVPALFELTSQFRHWRFSKAELAAIRKETNGVAIENSRKNLALEAQLVPHPVLFCFCLALNLSSSCF